MNKITSEKNPSFGFVVFLVFIFFVYARPYEIPGLMFMIPLQPTRIFMVAALIIYGLRGFKGLDPLRDGGIRWFFVLQVLVLALLPLSVWQSNSVEQFVSTNLRITATFLLAITAANTIKTIDALIRIIYISSCMVALRIIHAYHIGNYIYDAGGIKRVIGIGTLGSSDPNDVALVLAMIVPIGLYYWHTRTGIKKIFCAAILAAMIVALLVSGSRGGYLAVGMSAAIFYALLYRNQKIKYIAVIGLISLMAVIAVPSEYKARFQSIFSEEDYTHTDQRHGRIAVWKRSWTALLKRPIGYGRGNTQIAEGQEKSAEGTQGKWMVTHNSYLQIGLELGFLGLFCYLMFLFSGFVNIAQILGLCRGPDTRNYEVLACSLGAGLSAFMVASFFLSQAYNWNPYIFIALTIALKRLMPSRPAQPTDPADQPSLTGTNSRLWKSRALSGTLKDERN